MSRLIDADLFVAEFSKLADKHRDNVAMSVMFDVFIDAVNTFPTTYDLDKVVAELKEKKDEASIEAGKRSVRIGEDEYEDDPYYEGKKHAYGHAIEMVRKGGVE